jgi:hypothetical protein
MLGHRNLATTSVYLPGPAAAAISIVLGLLFRLAAPVVAVVAEIGRPPAS